MKYVRLKKITIFCLLSVLLIVYCQLLPVTVKASLIDDLKRLIEEKDREIKELQEQAAAYQETLQGIEQQKDTLTKQLSLINARVKKIEADIEVTQARIWKSSLKIEELTLEIDEKENDIISQKENIASIIRTIYEYDQESLVELILENDNFSDFLNDVQYMELLQMGVQERLKSLRALKTELEKQKQEMEVYKEQQISLKNQLAGQKSVVDNQKREKDELLRQTKGQEVHYQQLLSDAKEKQRQIQEEIFEIEEKLRLTLDPESIPKFRPGVLSWPNEGLLTQGYGCIETSFARRTYQSCSNGQGGYHNGIDIAAGYGAPIRAAQDGVIRAMGNTDKYCPGGAYGRWIAIEHGNNLTTFYAHFSAYGRYGIGDSVKKGDIIGYEGSSGLATGSHLHFGVYASNTFHLKQTMYCSLIPAGADINPMSYL